MQTPAASTKPPSVFATWLVLALATAPLWAQAPPAVQRGDKLFQTDFEGANALKAWGKVDAAKARLSPGRGGSQAVMVTVPETPGNGPKGATISLPLPTEKYRGLQVRCGAWVKAEGVKQPPNSWNGIKVMLHLVSPSGQDYLQKSSVHGTFDWKRVEFTAAIPTNVTSATLVLGLENTTGTAWFDDLDITVKSTPRQGPAIPPAGPKFTGHNLPRLRGAMIGPRLQAEDLRTLGQDWRANHVRWQLIWGGFPHSPADKASPEEYDRWLDGELKRLDSLLPVCREAGLLLTLDVHTPPGGRNQAKECQMFHERRHQEQFIAVWDKLARRYKDEPQIWGYDLVNEPVEGTVGEGLMDWQQLAEHVARRVRAIDPKHAIILEPAPWGGPESLAHFEPVDVPGVVYSVHMYQPHQFTHQGVYGSPMGILYPGQVGGKLWDKEALRRALQPARDFQLAYNAHLYIGEFSAIRWAPGDSATVYLREVIELMEEYGWDWAYHAFREWNGWSVEHGADPKDNRPSPQRTAREQLLRDWFAKNQKPPGAR